MDRRELYEAARKKWGLAGQLTVAIEELSELQKELCKYLRGMGDLVHLAEEVADVEIVVEQVKQFLCLDDAALEYKAEKLNRLEGRVSRRDET